MPSRAIGQDVCRNEVTNAAPLPKLALGQPGQAEHVGGLIESHAIVSIILAMAGKRAPWSMTATCPANLGGCSGSNAVQLIELLPWPGLPLMERPGRQ